MLGSKLSLMAAHVAGMIDLVALPLWVSSLMQARALNTQQAGMLVTLYLLGAVASSSFFAPRLNRLRAHVAAPLGFAAAAVLFVLLSMAHDFTLTALLHVAAGVATGCGLSFTHGTMGRMANPHRMFASAHMALAVFGILFFAGTPVLLAHFGGDALFLLFAVVSGCAALATLCAFPRLQGDAPAAMTVRREARLPANVWRVIAGLVCMGVTQAMIFSFVTQIGLAHGFAQASLDLVLVAVGIVNLLPPVLATLLQHRLNARYLALAGPVLQTLLALTICQSGQFWLYAACAGVYVFVMIFVHTFLFSLLARLDTSGRAVALTPAMLMTGSAAGPILGGALALHVGLFSLGYAALAISLVALYSFGRVRLPDGAGSTGGADSASDAASDAASDLVSDSGSDAASKMAA